MRVLIILMFLSNLNQAQSLPKGFAYLKDEVPSIEEDIRYFTDNNFIGERINGYLTPKSIMSIEATKALKEVQKSLKPMGLGLKVFDAYRPQKAVDHFVRWGLDLNDTKMKSIYYPNVEKKNLFKEGYIAKRSGHSRGSTVDLTLIELKSKQELDMGSNFDLFGKFSWFNFSKITSLQKENRELLHRIMLHNGFKFYTQEWWHFTLKNEPYPHRYFNFDID